MPLRDMPDHRFSAISAALVEHSAFLKKFLSRFFSSQQDIEDVVQEAYLRAFVAEQKRAIKHPKAFLFRVAKNVALTELTRKSRQITDYLEEAGHPATTGSGAGADEELEAQEWLGLYCEAISRLPDKCREVFLLRKVHGLRHNEIAHQMSLSLSSVEKYLQQGIVACKVFVAERQDIRAQQRRPATKAGLRNMLE